MTVLIWRLLVLINLVSELIWTPSLQIWTFCVCCLNALCTDLNAINCWFERCLYWFTLSDLNVFNVRLFCKLFCHFGADLNVLSTVLICVALGTDMDALRIDLNCLNIFQPNLRQDSLKSQQFLRRLNLQHQCQTIIVNIYGWRKQCTVYAWINREYFTETTRF